MKKIIIGSLLFIIYLGLNCCDNEKPEIDPFPEGYVFSFTSEIDKFEIIGATKDGECMAISTEGSHMAKEVFYQNKDFPGIYITIDDIGLPRTAYINGFTLLFENIKEETLDIGVINSTGQTLIIRDISYDFSDIIELSKETSASNKSEVDWGSVLKYGGLALDAGICLTSLIGTTYSIGALAPILVPIGALSCTSAITGILAEFVVEVTEEEKLGEFMTFYTASGGIPSPGSLVSIAGGIYEDAQQFKSSHSNEISNTYNNLSDSHLMDLDGKIYSTIQIGDQIWMAENFAYMPYVSRDGIYVRDYEGFDTDMAKQTTNYKTYGCWYDAPIAIELAPMGWHLPTSEEFDQLINYVNGDDSKLIQMSDLWTKYIEIGNNQTGFSAKPAGQIRSPDTQGVIAYFKGANIDLNGNIFPYAMILSLYYQTDLSAPCVDQKVSVRYIKD